MTWSECIALVRRRLQETSAAFFTDEYLKLYGIEAQRDMAERAPEMFPIYRTFTTVSGTDEYDLSSYGGPDFATIVRVSYSDTEAIGNIPFSAKPVTSMDGNATRYYLRGTTLGFYPEPSSAETVGLWGYRMPPRYPLTIYHDGSASSTAATAGIASNTLSLVITGGTNAGTDTFDLTAAANDTITELAAAINALAKGFTATVSGDVLGTTETSVLLEAIGAASCYQATISMYENPEVPNYAFRALVEGMIYRAFLEGHEDDLARTHEQRYETALMQSKKTSEVRARGRGFRTMPDVYDNSFASNEVSYLKGGRIFY